MKAGSLEPMLHAAIIQAVAIMNVCPEVALSEEARKAHVILREALVKYADAYMDQPTSEAEQRAMRKKHGGGK